MQSFKDLPLKEKLRRYRLGFQFLRRFTSHPEALEAFLVEVKEWGASEEHLLSINNTFTALWNTRHDKMAEYRHDRYLLTGIGAAHLVA